VSTIPIIHRDHHRSGFYFYFALACLQSRLFIGTTTAVSTGEDKIFFVV
jgi:hypothetical protein